jgi:hypothetical protein
MKNISEMSTTELIKLPYSDVVQRVRSGEWGVEHFTQWAEDRLNYAFGDGYDEGYETGEEQERTKKLENKSMYVIMQA